MLSSESQVVIDTDTGLTVDAHVTVVGSDGAKKSLSVGLTTT